MTTPLTPDAAQDSVIEILATWGATAEPSLAVLVAALEEAGASRGLVVREALSRAIAEVPDRLGPELRQSIVAALEGHAAPADLVVWLERVVDVLGPEVEDGLRRVASEAAQWSLHGEVATAAAVWSRIGALEGAESAVQLMDALRVLSDIETVLGDSRTEVVRELRGLPGGTEVSEDDLASLLGTLRRLRSSVAESDVARKSAELREASAALEALVSKAEETARSIEGGPESGRPAVLRMAAAAASEAARTPADDAEDLDARLARVASWTDGLGSLIDQAAATGRSDRVWTGVVEAFKNEILSMAPRAQVLPDAGRPPALSDLSRLDDELMAAATQGSGTFHEAFIKGLKTFQEVRAAVDAATLKSASRLRDTAGRLESFVGRVATKLPTARIVTARSHLVQIDAVIAERDVSSIDKLEQVIQRELETLQHDLALIEKHQRDREEARRDSLRDEIQRLHPAASGRRAASLEDVDKRLSGASGSQIDALWSQIRALRRDIESGIRIAATKWFERAEKLVGKGGKNREELASAARVVGSCREEDDLPALATATRVLSQAVRAAEAPRRRRMMLGGGTILLATVVAVGYWALRGPGTKTYSLGLEAPPASGTASVALVRDGRVAETLDVGGTAVDVDLAPGRYEVFVDRRYTGRVIDVPRDDASVRVSIPPP